MKENSIEEDIKLLEELDWLYLDKPEIICDRYEEATNHILSDYKRVLKENEELKEENEYNKILLDMNNNFTIDKKTGNYKWNVIEIQKVKDKIKEEKMPLTIVGGIRNKKILKYGISLGRMQVLQELIEESGEK